MIKKLFVLLIFRCSTPAMVLQKTANNDLPFVYYADKTNDFDIEKIKSLPTSSWKRVKNFKRFSSVVWLRLEIANDCGDTIKTDAFLSCIFFLKILDEIHTMEELKQTT